MVIHEDSVKWFNSLFVTKATDCYNVNQADSIPMEITCSVLQGSILGPLLYLCYVNDIIPTSVNYNLLLYNLC